MININLCLLHCFLYQLFLEWVNNEFTDGSAGRPYLALQEAFHPRCFHGYLQLVIHSAHPSLLICQPDASSHHLSWPPYFLHQQRASNKAWRHILADLKTSFLTRFYYMTQEEREIDWSWKIYPDAYVDISLDEIFVTSFTATTCASPSSGLLTVGVLRCVRTVCLLSREASGITHVTLCKFTSLASFGWKRPLRD